MRADKIIEQIADYYGLTIKALSQKLGHKRPDSLYVIRKRKPERLSERLINDFSRTFPELSEHFLRTGSGDIVDIHYYDSDKGIENYIKHIEKTDNLLEDHPGRPDKDEIIKLFKHHILSSKNTPDKTKIQLMQEEIMILDQINTLFFKALYDYYEYGDIKNLEVKKTITKFIEEIKEYSKTQDNLDDIDPTIDTPY